MIKNNFAVHVFTCMVIFSAVFQSKAQTGTLSPYSRYGIGELQFNGYVYQRAMGGIGTGIQRVAKLNFLNPASYATDTLTTAEFGADGTYMTLSYTDKSQKKQNGNLSYLTLGFPVVKHKWGMTVGITPYSAVGYEIKETKLEPVIANYYYNGSGGINRFNIGNGFNITKDFSAGLNVSYLFGSLSRVRKVEFLNTGYLNNRYTNTITVSDIYLDYGLQYRFHLKQRYELVVGLTGTNSTKINAKRNVLWENYINRTTSGSVTTPIDTVQFIKNETGDIVFPFVYTVGAFLSQANHWGVGMDFNYQDWSNYKSFGESDTLDKSIRIALGGQIIPDYKSLNYLSRVEYRIGGYYHDGNLKLKNTSIDDYGITAGIGLPLRKSYQSMIDFTVEFGQRGTTDNNLVREQYTKFMIGLTFNEDWFHKRKFD